MQNGGGLFEFQAMQIHFKVALKIQECAQRAKMVEL
jgi:hypothetical protein